MAEYCTVNELKETLVLQSESFADDNITVAIIAASRAIDHFTDRRFDVDQIDQIRYYTPDNPGIVWVNDLVTLTGLATDDQGNGTFTQPWVANTDFVLEPLNAPADGRPYTSVRVNGARTSLYLPAQYERSVRVTGRFGWPEVPGPVKQATLMLAGRLVKLVREAPFGVAGFGMDGAAVRVAADDPNVRMLLCPYVRGTYP